MRIVVEGIGQWARQKYLPALQTAKSKINAVFVYDSTFGLADPNRPAKERIDGLQQTLANVEQVERAGFACYDSKDTLYSLKNRRHEGRKAMFPHADAVIIVTPDVTHCDIAEYWHPRTERIFVEKPFAESSERANRFIGWREGKPGAEVYAIDHYFVRCNQVASDTASFLSRLLPVGPDWNLQKDITGFEFRMTENDSRKSLQERKMSVQAGMVLDMATHAFPCLLPFVDISTIGTPHRVWAGRSADLEDIMHSGAETFSAAEFECVTVPFGRKPGTSRIKGKVIIGKDIGAKPEKYLRIYGPHGTVEIQFDLGQVRYIPLDGPPTPIAALYEQWAPLLIDQLAYDQVPTSADMFTPRGAAKVLAILDRWREKFQHGSLEFGQTLPIYERGATVESLLNDKYSVG